MSKFDHVWTRKLEIPQVDDGVKLIGENNRNRGSQGPIAGLLEIKCDKTRTWLHKVNRFMEN